MSINLLIAHQRVINSVQKEYNLSTKNKTGDLTRLNKNLAKAKIQAISNLDASIECDGKGKVIATVKIREAEGKAKAFSYVVYDCHNTNPSKRYADKERTELVSRRIGEKCEGKHQKNALARIQRGLGIPTEDKKQSKKKYSADAKASDTEKRITTLEEKIDLLIAMQSKK